MFTISGCKFERNWYSKDIVCRRLISLCCPFSAGGIFILAAILIPVKGCKKIVAETEGLGIENKHNQLPNNFAFGLGFNYILFTSSLTFSGNLPFFPFLSLSFWWKKPSHSKPTRLLICPIFSGIPRINGLRNLNKTLHQNVGEKFFSLLTA